MQSDTYQRLLDAIEVHISGLDGFLNITEEKIGQILLEALKVEHFSAHKEVVRQVLFDYFASHGFRAYIVIKHDRDITYRLKINDYDGCIYTEACMQQLPKLENALTPSKSRPGISVLDSAVYKSITDFLNKYIQEEEDKKGLFKAILKNSLGLSPRDAIFFVDQGVLVKQFQESETSQNSIGQLSSTSQRLHEGLDKTFLKEIENMALKNGLKKNMAELIVSLLKGPLNVSEHDNLYFAKNFVPILQEKFLDFVPDDKRIQNPEIKQALANYILRNHFNDCTNHFAKEIIGKLINKEQGVDAFIKFYNGDVSFSPEGKRYTRPEIMDKDGNRWNSATIFQIGMQRKMGLDKIARNIEAIRLTEESIAKCKNNIKMQEDFIENNLSVIASFEAEIQKKLDISGQAKENIFELKRRLQNTQKGTAAATEIQNKINALSIQIKQLDRDEKHIFGEKKKLDAELEKAKAKIITLEKDQVSYEYKLGKDKEQKEQLAKNQIPLEQRYSIVVEAFSKALSSFRGF
ncbi:hypothetical protein CCZ01_03540 [Helicobacter monodelphidis]|uniref:hypothetical protein n=1 Tax=Helicobacter sp. 15-1451 TaxID=2004995 RepID=UPI000DCE9607|nr:hypothetical protein [Helicobacter sp. 15-1451]RAX58159.1 hypothetical protein CCZ01_03540 [Helicobacter sp. 15-1451]